MLGILLNIKKSSFYFINPNLEFGGSNAVKEYSKIFGINKYNYNSVPICLDNSENSFSNHYKSKDIIKDGILYPGLKYELMSSNLHKSFFIQY